MQGAPRRGWCRGTRPRWAPRAAARALFEGGNGAHQAGGERFGHRPVGPASGGCAHRFPAARVLKAPRQGATLSKQHTAQAENRAPARLPCPTSRRPGAPTRPVSPTDDGGKEYCGRRREGGGKAQLDNKRAQAAGTAPPRGPACASARLRRSTAAAPATRHTAAHCMLASTAPAQAVWRSKAVPSQKPKGACR